MKLVYNLLTCPINLKLGDFWNIIIENTREFRYVVENLENKSIQIFHKDIETKNFLIIENLFFLDFNDRKILNALYKNLIRYSKDELNILKTLEINGKLRLYLEELIDEINYPLDLNVEFDLNNIFKAYGLSVRKEYESFIEKIVDYIRLNNEILSLNIFITINLNQILTEDELIELIEFLRINEILLINFDRIYIKRDCIKNQILIDDDLCRIL